MTELEQRLADGIRENGDTHFAGLPDWPNTEIEVGDQPLRITAERLEEPRTSPPVYHHTLRVPLAGLVRVQELIGLESIGDSVLVDAEILADRAEDGPVIGVTAIRHWYDKVGRRSFMMMRSPKGVPLLGRWSTVGNAQRGCIGELRRHRRRWIADFEMQGVSLDRLLLDPRADWGVLGDVSHVCFFDRRLELGCDGREAFADLVRAGNGNWLAARCGQGHSFRTGYESGAIIPLGMSDDPDDLFLEGAFG